MSKEAFVRARIEPSLKKNAESVLSKLGITPSQAITIFYKQVELNDGLPFPVKIPNEITVAAIEASDRREGLTHHDSPDALFKKLGI